MERLSDQVIHKIASNQNFSTVEHILKELLENSLDAHATNIEVSLVGDGLEKITVADNGTGISRLDRPLVGIAHCTSKLPNGAFQDLDTISTFGFRGEALSCLLAVCRSVKISTRTREEQVGETWELGEYKPHATAMNSGTVIDCIRLFDQQPVRRQHLPNRKGAESCLRLIKQFSIVFPHVRFSLVCSQDDAIPRVQWSRPVCGSRLEALALCFPTFKTTKFATFSLCKNQVSVEMVLPESPNGVATNKPLLLFANKRLLLPSCPFFKPVLAQIRQVYSSSSKWPIGYISITVPPSQVDVNIEPSKNILIFSEEPLIREIFVELVAQVHERLKNSSEPVSYNIGSSQRGLKRCSDRSTAHNHSKLAKQLTSDGQFFTKKINSGRPAGLQTPESPKHYKQLLFTQFTNSQNEKVVLNPIDLSASAHTLSQQTISKRSKLHSLSERAITDSSKLEAVAALDVQFSQLCKRLYFGTWRSRIIVFSFPSSSQMQYVILKLFETPKVVSLPECLHQTILDLLINDARDPLNTGHSLNLLNQSFKDFKALWITSF